MSTSKPGRGAGRALTAAVLCSVLWPLPAAAGAAPAEVIRDAAGLVREGQYARACALLSEDSRTTEALEALFLLGRCSFETGRHEEAIKYYSALLSREEAPRVRAELGKAYLANNQPEQARREFARAIAANPPEPIRTQLIDLVTGIDAASHFFWRASLGLAHDSNVNVGPSPSTFEVFGLQFEIAPDSKPRSDWAAKGTVSGNFIKPLSGRLAAQAEMALDFTDYRRTNDFDFLQANVAAGVLWRGDDWLMTTPLTYEHAQLGGATYTSAYGVASQVNYTLSEATHLRLATVLQKREFPATPDRDGSIVGSSVSFRRSVPFAAAAIEVGARHLDERAELDALANRANSVLLAVESESWAGWSAAFESSYTRVRYRAPELIFDRTRRDQRTVYGLTLAKSLRNGMASVSLIGSWTRNRSNIALNDYRRRLLSVQGTMQF